MAAPAAWATARGAAATVALARRLGEIGLHVVLDELLGLRGAAQVALQLARRY